MNSTPQENLYKKVLDKMSETDIEIPGAVFSALVSLVDESENEDQ